MPGTDPFPSYRPDGPGRGEAYDSEHWVGTSNDWISFFFFFTLSCSPRLFLFDFVKIICFLVKISYNI